MRYCRALQDGRGVTQGGRSGICRVRGWGSKLLSCLGNVRDTQCLGLGGDKDPRIWKGLWCRSAMRASPDLSFVSVKNTCNSDTDLPFQRGRKLAYSFPLPSYSSRSASSSSNLSYISFLQFAKCFGKPLSESMKVNRIRSSAGVKQNCSIIIEEMAPI